MRRILPWLAIALVLLSPAAALAAKKAAPAPKAAPAVQAAQDSRIEGVTFVRLRNGLGVVVKEDERFPLAHIRMLVHAGSAYETPEQAGISHVLEHMVFKGAGDMKPGESARRIEAAGGSLNASTSFDTTEYHVEVPDRHWRMGLSVVADMTFRPSLMPAELESEKEVVLAELKRGEDSPDTLLFHTVQGLVFRGTSYERPIIGYRNTVRAVTSESMRRYIAPLYQPQNMLLVVVGRVKAAEVLAEAEARLGGMANTGRITPPAPFPAPVAGGPRVSVVPGVWNKVHLALAFPAPEFSATSRMAELDMLAQVLGGDETSRLHRLFKYQLRMVDGISVGASNLERGGVLMVSAVLDADKLPAFWDRLLAELARFDARSVSDAEIARARANIEASLFLARETLAGLASKLSHQYAFEGGQEGEANYLAAVAATDRARLAAAFRGHFRPQALSAVVLAPKAAGVDQAQLLAALKRRWPAPEAEAKARAEASGGGVRQVALPGGSTLVLLPDATLPYAAVSLAFGGGDGLLAPAEQGLAALAASMLTRGAGARSANQVEDFLSDRAASLSASASAETFSVSAKFPSRFSADMLGLLRETLTAPAFAAGELARAKEDQQNAITRAEDQPIPLLFRRLPQLVFASAPHAYQRLGTKEAVAAYTREQAAAFWKRQSARPFVLSVCGSFDAEALTAFAKTLAGELTREPALEARVPDWKDAREAALRLPGRKQSHLLVLFRAPGRADQEQSARLSLLRAALAGQSGLLFRDLRDRQGLGYVVTAFLSQYREAGFFAFYIGVDPDKLQQALEGFRKAAQELAQKPLPEAELERARNILSGDYYQDRQALMARSREASGALVQGLDREAERALVERAQALSAEDVRQAAAAVLRWDGAFVLKLEP